MVLLRKTVAGDELAIGYLSLSFVNSDVKAVKVDGAEPTVENIKSDTYKISRPFLYLTKGEAERFGKDIYRYVLQAFVINSKCLSL